MKLDEAVGRLIATCRQVLCPTLDARSVRGSQQLLRFLATRFGSHQRFSEMFRCHWVIDLWGLVSNSELRYEGVLYTINTQDLPKHLQNVAITVLTEGDPAFSWIHQSSSVSFHFGKVCWNQNCFLWGVFMCWFVCFLHLASAWGAQKPHFLLCQCLFGSERNDDFRAAAAADPCCSSECAETPAERCAWHWSTAGRLSVLPHYRGEVCDVVWLCVQAVTRIQNVNFVNIQNQFPFRIDRTFPVPRNPPFLCWAQSKVWEDVRDLAWFGILVVWNWMWYKSGIKSWLKVSFTSKWIWI